MLRKDEGKPFRSVLMSSSARLINMVAGQIQSQPGRPPSPLGTTKTEMQFQAILIINILISYQDDWLAQHRQLVINLLKIWVSTDFQERHRKVVSTHILPFWNSCKRIFKYGIQCTIIVIQVVCSYNSVINPDSWGEPLATRPVVRTFIWMVRAFAPWLAVMGSIPAHLFCWDITVVL